MCKDFRLAGTLAKSENGDWYSSTPWDSYLKAGQCPPQLYNQGHVRATLDLDGTAPRGRVDGGATRPSMENLYEQRWLDANGNCVGHGPIPLKQDSHELGMFDARIDVTKKVTLWGYKAIPRLYQH